MELRNKKTGEVKDIQKVICEGVLTHAEYSLAELNKEWEDAPKVKPKKLPYIFPAKVRRAVLAWLKAQDNPIEEISILLHTYYDTKEVDSDGYYFYTLYGYVKESNKNLVANQLDIRLKKPFEYDEGKDYTPAELGIYYCGGEKCTK